MREMIKTDDPLPVEMSNEHERQGVEYAAKSFNDFYDKSLKGLSAAMRIAALCYNSPEIQKMASLDEYGENWIEDISSALCALANIDSRIRERIIYSINKTQDIYDIRDMNCHLNELGN